MGVSLGAEPAWGEGSPAPHARLSADLGLGTNRNPPTEPVETGAGGPQEPGARAAGAGCSLHSDSCHFLGRVGQRCGEGGSRAPTPGWLHFSTRSHRPQGQPAAFLELDLLSGREPTRLAIHPAGLHTLLCPRTHARCPSASRPRLELSSGSGAFPSCQASDFTESMQHTSSRKSSQISIRL